MAERRTSMEDALADIGGVGDWYRFAERMFVDALRNGWTYFQAHPETWTRVLRLLDATEVATVVDLFGTAGRVRDLKVFVGYPAAAGPFPQIAIMVLEETTRPDGELIGDMRDAGIELEEFGNDGQLGDDHGEMRTRTLGINIVADHPDVVLYLAAWADYTLQAHDNWFERSGLTEPRFVGSASVIPDPRQPDRLWGQQLRWQISGFYGHVEPMPDPPSRVSVALKGALVNGLLGRVTVGNP